MAAPSFPLHQFVLRGDIYTHVATNSLSEQLSPKVCQSCSFLERALLDLGGGVHFVDEVESWRSHAESIYYLGCSMLTCTQGDEMASEKDEANHSQQSFDHFHLLLNIYLLILEWPVATEQNLWTGLTRVWTDTDVVRCRTDFKGRHEVFTKYVPKGRLITHILGRFSFKPKPQEWWMVKAKQINIGHWNCRTNGKMNWAQPHEMWSEFVIFFVSLS